MGDVMSLGFMGPEATRRFDALCRVVAARGQGLSLREIGRCAALARELTGGEPDPDRLEDLARRLDVDLDALEGDGVA